MQPSHGQGQGARGPRRNSESLEQRLQRTHVALQQQGAVSFVGQQGAAAQPYALPPGFPPQGQGQPFGQAQQFAAGPIAPGSQFGSSAVQPQLDRRAFPIAAQRLALQLQPGAAIPQPYAALYPQYPPAYGFMAPGAQWRPGLSQQVPAGFPPQPHLMQAGFAYPAQLPVRPPAQAGRQQGMPGRGRAGRRYNGSRGRGAAQQGAQQYRDMWQEVTQVRHYECNPFMQLTVYDASSSTVLHRLA